MNISTENGSQMILPGLDLETYRRPNVTVSDFRVKLFQLLESGEALKIHEALYFLTSCGLLKNESLKYYSLKMSPDCLITMGGDVRDNHSNNGGLGVYCRMANA